MLGIDDDPREPRGIEQPFLLVEVPAARLLRHQPPLQPVGELGDGALEMDELLVEIGAKPAELLLVAQLRRLDDLVILGGEDPVVELGRQIGERPVRPDRQQAVLAILAERVRFGHVLLGPFALRFLAAFVLLAADLGLAAAGAFVGLVLAFLVAALGLVAVFLLVARVGLRVTLGLALDQLEVAQQLADQGRERRLVVERETERIEIAAGFVLDPSGDQLEPRSGFLGRRLAGQPLAHHQPDRRGERHFLAVARAGERIGAQPEFGQPREIVADPGHAARAERLAARLLGGVEHRARGLVGRRGAGVEPRIVMAQPQRRRIGEAARLGHFARR